MIVVGGIVYDDDNRVDVTGTLSRFGGGPERIDYANAMLSVSRRIMDHVVSLSNAGVALALTNRLRDEAERIARDALNVAVGHPDNPYHTPVDVRIGDNPWVRVHGWDADGWLYTEDDREYRNRQVVQVRISAYHDRDH